MQMLDTNWKEIGMDTKFGEHDGGSSLCSTETMRGKICDMICDVCDADDIYDFPVLVLRCIR